MPTRRQGCQSMARLWFTLRRLIAKSWLLSRCYYRFRGARLLGRPKDQVWYFAYGANMHDSAFRDRRGIRSLECRAGHVKGYRLRFNLRGRPKGKAAPANLCLEPEAEVWGALYRITRRDLMRLDATEGVPGRGGRWQAIAPLYHVTARGCASPRTACGLHPLFGKRRILSIDVGRRRSSYRRRLGCVSPLVLGSPRRSIGERE